MSRTEMLWAVALAAGFMAFTVVLVVPHCLRGESGFLRRVNGGWKSRRLVG
jgi:hypothetical protein